MYFQSSANWVTNDESSAYWVVYSENSPPGPPPHGCHHLQPPSGPSSGKNRYHHLRPDRRPSPLQEEFPTFRRHQIHWITPRRCVHAPSRRPLQSGKFGISNPLYASYRLTMSSRRSLLLHPGIGRFPPEPIPVSLLHTTATPRPTPSVPKKCRTLGLNVCPKKNRFPRRDREILLLQYLSFPCLMSGE